MKKRKTKRSNLRNPRKIRNKRKRKSNLQKSVRTINKKRPVRLKPTRIPLLQTKKVCLICQNHPKALRAIKSARFDEEFITALDNGYFIHTQCARSLYAWEGVCPPDNKDIEELESRIQCAIALSNEVQEECRYGCGIQNPIQHLECDAGEACTEPPKGACHWYCHALARMDNADTMDPTFSWENVMDDGTRGCAMFCTEHIPKSTKKHQKAPKSTDTNEVPIKVPNKVAGAGCHKCKRIPCEKNCKERTNNPNGFTMFGCLKCQRSTSECTCVPLDQLDNE